MAKKRTAPYSREKSVKAVARERVGSPPPSRPIDEKPKRDKPKHKKPWTDSTGV